MDCKRKIIYFSTYENGVKKKSAGYAAFFIRGESCDVQIYYRESAGEKTRVLQPVFMFFDGIVVLGNKFETKEGMAAAFFRTGQSDFMQSGRSLEELETVYLDGVENGICGGRMDGQELEEEAYTLTEQPERLNEAKELPAERWSLQQCLNRFPELKLPFDGMRRACCRMSPEDMEHLPEQWQFLKNNHFLLHGYYEYHHLLLAKLACRYGERYAVGVPGEFCYRNQYMAESFGFYDFAPLEPGKRRGGCFGYWYYYLEHKNG